MKTENNTISCFVHWKDGEITQVHFSENDFDIDGIAKTYEAMKNEIDGLEFFNHKTYEITTKFF